jgi:hypothetical protein
MTGRESGEQLYFLCSIAEKILMKGYFGTKKKSKNEQEALEANYASGQGIKSQACNCFLLTAENNAQA